MTVERHSDRLRSVKTKQMLGSFPTGLVITQLQQRIRQVSVTAKGNVAAGKSRSRVQKKIKTLPA